MAKYPIIKKKKPVVKKPAINNRTFEKVTGPNGIVITKPGKKP